MLKKLLLILYLSSFSFIANAVASTYIIDGSVSDWGINLFDSAATYKGYLDTHLPTGATVDVAHEDNTDDASGSFQVGPGWSDDNTYDAEAMYFDNDAEYLYIAIVTGLPGTESGVYPTGDIAISIDGNDSTYEYGLKLYDSKLYSVTSWYDPYFTEATPWRIDQGSIVGSANYVYSDEQNTHYVLEARILLADLGLTDDSTNAIDVHWTMNCGNDYLNVRGTIDPAPEPASLSLLGIGLLGLLVRKRKLA